MWGGGGNITGSLPIIYVSINTGVDTIFYIYYSIPLVCIFICALCIQSNIMEEVLISTLHTFASNYDTIHILCKYVSMHILQ